MALFCTIDLRIHLSDIQVVTNRVSSMCTCIYYSDPNHPFSVLIDYLLSYSLLTQRAHVTTGVGGRLGNKVLCNSMNG